MLKALVASVLALAGLALCAREGGACTCVSDRSPCSRYVNSEVAFVARVVSKTTSADGKVDTFRMRVLRAGKGVAAQQIVEVDAGDADNNCGFDAAEGQRWVVYATREHGRLSTHRCANNRELEHGEPMPALPPEPGSVSGRLTRWNDEAEESVGVAGAAVWIEVPGRQIRSRTGDGGWFALRQVPVGRHVVRFDVGVDASAEADVELFGLGDCGEGFALVRAGGGIVGTLVEVDGAPLRNVDVTIEPHDYGPVFDWTRSNGEFRFTGLEPGEYTIGVGLENRPSGPFPYRSSYFPGVPEEARARTITVGTRIVTLPPFVMREPLPTAHLRADIVCRDGTRPSAAMVEAVPFNNIGRQDQDQTFSPATPLRVRVLRGQPVSLVGIFDARFKRPDGSTVPTRKDTAPLEVATEGDPGLVRLVADAEHCDAPGGPIIDPP